MWKRLKSKQPVQNTRSEDLDDATSSTSESQDQITPIFTSPQLTFLNRRRNSDTNGLLDVRKPIVPSRRGSQLSEISNVQRELFPSASVEHQQRRLQDRRDDPMGLTVLHSPESKYRTVDILFIHGLGGTSIRTWCKNRDLELFWPKKWLPEEPDLSTARILTFGYNANFAAKKEQASLTIGDFANDLLFHMKYDEEGNERMGQVPIIVVAHSMGGLVFKKAYIYGHLNEQYRKITSSIKAVLFMATPHRGVDLAETLHRILASSIFGHSPKEYVKELTQGSTTIDELNDTFRHHAEKLQIFSFYETLTTPVGPMNVMLLEKHTSLLGYHNETPEPLMANHHDVVKFSSPDDPNYKSVRGAIRSIVNQFRLSNTREDEAEKGLEAIQKWLGVTGLPEEDLSLLRSTRKAGTCQHLLQKPEFADWLDSEIPHTLWIHAAPGSGKSVQCSFVIETLQMYQKNCVYWFFKAGDVQKRSLGAMLRSVAYQIALEDDSYRLALTDVRKSGIKVDEADAWTVWRNIFASRLSAIGTEMHLVIDGLDESESSRTFIDLISTIDMSKSNLRILFFSRPLSNINQVIQKARRKFTIIEVALTDNLEDIRLAAADEMEYFLTNSGFEEFKQQTIEEITTRSQGNFLWASLILKMVVNCHRQDEVKEVLEATPDGMDKLYHGMTEAIARVDREENTILCKILLSWAMYSTRPVTVEELMEPYASELHAVIDLKHTISEICGQFVVINASNRVVLVHQTAREYLRTCTKLPFSLEAHEVNEDLFHQCLNFLCDLSLRTKIRQRKAPLFLSYASVSWDLHLTRSSVESDRVLETLVKFFSGTFPLPWIQYLAITGHLSHLVTVSSHLMSFVRQRRKLDAVKEPPLLRLPELSLIESWAADLLKMTAKFGSHLIDDPDAIYKYIPPLSPKNSMIYQKYANKSSATISVSGISNGDWDDCLARISNPGSDSALHIAVSADYLAVANDSPNGRIQLWSLVIFEELSTFNPGEPICSISFSPSGSLLVCYCLNSTYVWRVSDRSIVAQVENPRRERPLSIKFGQEESFLIIATDLRRVYRLNFDDESPTWVGFDSALLEETSLPEGAFINSPSSVDFNPDCTQLAVAYRGFPLAVWSLDPPEVIARCRRKKKQGQTTNLTWTGVNRVAWHPFNGQVLGIYRDGNIFKWGPIDDSYEEVKQELDATPSEIQCSRNGLVFATSDVKGSIKIYDYSQMVQMYKLTSDDIIKDIAFSPDSRRLYDLRGSCCNVWEPSCLLRAVDTSLDPSDDNESVTSSERRRNGSIVSEHDDKGNSIISLPASEAHDDSKPPITAVATCMNNQNIFAYATDDGTIELYNIEGKYRHPILHSYFGVDVNHLAMGQDGEYIAYCLLNGRVAVKSIDFSAPDKASIQNVFAETKSIKRGLIRQLLFDGKSERLLVCGVERLQVLRIADGSIVSEKEISPTDQPAQWTNHPTDPDIVLGFTVNGVIALSWDTLDIKCTLSHDLACERADNQSKPKSSVALEVLVQSYSQEMQIIVTIEETEHGRLWNYLLLDTSVIYNDSSAPSSSGTISTVPFPPHISECMEEPVVLLADGRLVFLDSALWVCTVQLGLQSGGASEAGVTRHFFIPRDWLNSAGLSLCKVQADGNLLCLCKGEMAVISSDIGTGW